MTKFKKAAANVATIIAVAAIVGASIFMGCDGFANNEPKKSGADIVAGRSLTDPDFSDRKYTLPAKESKDEGVLKGVYVHWKSGSPFQRELRVVSKIETYEENLKGLLDKGLSIEETGICPEGYPMFDVYSREIDFEGGVK
jgi:hypothetical protein